MPSARRHRASFISLCLHLLPLTVSVCHPLPHSPRPLHRRKGHSDNFCGQWQTRMGSSRVAAPVLFVQMKMLRPKRPPLPHTSGSGSFAGLGSYLQTSLPHPFLNPGPTSAVYSAGVARTPPPRMCAGGSARLVPPEPPVPLPVQESLHQLRYTRPPKKATLASSVLSSSQHKRHPRPDLQAVLHTQVSLAEKPPPCSHTSCRGTRRSGVPSPEFLR